ncbi:hypothetical protein ACUXV3_13320 [Roseobacteraceae bacterium NS-SX3]
MMDEQELESRLQRVVRVLQEKGGIAGVVHHPDQQLLRDWTIYGPKDPRIEQLVWRLAQEHGLRVTEIEELIVGALERRLGQLE